MITLAMALNGCRSGGEQRPVAAITPDEMIARVAAVLPPIDDWSNTVFFYTCEVETPEGEHRQVIVATAGLWRYAYWSFIQPSRDYRLRRAEYFVGAPRTRMVWQFDADLPGGQRACFCLVEMPGDQAVLLDLAQIRDWARESSDFMERHGSDWYELRDDRLIYVADAPILSTTNSE